jgi:L-seryl-tRNA(Ser) seleniumtransferase
MWADPYNYLGIRPFIHCAGVRTIHGGTLMLPEVVKAMQSAALAFANIDELMAAVGRRIAELTGAEAAIVTSGCAAALCHATAAALTGADPERMMRLPDTSDVQATVIMLSSGRYAYDHAIRMTGARIVEVETREQLVSVLDKGAALIALLGFAEEFGKLRLPDIAPIARQHGVPILVDAAGEILQKPNHYLSRGASMVAYSGGKYLRGPQCSGLLLGEDRWIRAAWMHSAPHHTFGRPMKVGKEEIVGLLAAVEVWAASRKLEEERKVWDTDLDSIAAAVSRVPGVSTKRLPQASSTDLVPKLEISWSAEELPVQALEVRAELMNGTPRIMLDDRGSSSTSLLILPFALQPGEAAVVGEALHRALSPLPSRSRSAATEKVAHAEGSSTRADGVWDVDIAFAVGSARHRLQIVTDGTVISGSHRTLYFENALKGAIAGDRVDFSSQHRFEGTSLAYRFIGEIHAGGKEMSGSVELGSNGQSAPGPLNMKEYGKGTWRAKRAS